MSERIVVLGAGFGGLELATTLSETLGEGAQVTLIDKSDAFVFGFSKLDIMFRRAPPDSVRMHYRDLAKPGVRAWPCSTTTASCPSTCSSAFPGIARPTW